MSYHYFEHDKNNYIKVSNNKMVRVQECILQVIWNKKKMFYYNSLIHQHYEVKHYCWIEMNTNQFPFEQLYYQDN